MTFLEEKMIEEKNKRVYNIKSYIKEYFLLFILLAAFSGNHMWIIQIFTNTGMLETHLRLEEADKALYSAKEAGRNRVVVK